MNLPSSAKYDRTIYHYTSLDAFLKIIDSEVLWATETGCLNDMSEIIVAQAALEPFKEYWWQGRHDFPDSLVGEALIESTIDLLGNESWPPTYVSSFSAREDQLALWNGYSRSGTGVCFGLSEAALTRTAKANGFKILDCKYAEQMYADEDSPEVLRGMGRIIGCYPAKSRWSRQEQPEDADARVREEEDRIGPYINDRLSEITMQLASIKHHSWKIEEEIRAISVTNSLDGVFHRTNGAQLIPYRELPLPKSEDGTLQIESICFWASPYPEQTRLRLTDLTRTKRIRTSCGGDCTVRPSTNPFRPRSKQA